MAVIETDYSSALVIVFQTGVNPLGAPVTRQKTINYLRPTASTEDVYEVAHALFDLVQNPVIDVLRRKTTRLAEE